MEDASPPPTLVIVSVISKMGALKARIVHEQPNVLGLGEDCSKTPGESEEMLLANTSGFSDNQRSFFNY